MNAAFTFARTSRRSRREEGVAGYEQKQGRGKRAHYSVLAAEAVRLLAPKAGEVVVDATYGMGGHSKALMHAARVRLVALDADPQAAGVIEGNFADLDAILKKERVGTIHKALFDLGWHMGQLEAGKGFSFLHDEPLNMSYGAKPRSGFTARDILNEWPEKVLADVFFGYGEERYARRIAKAVAARRVVMPIETTLELVEIINDAVPAAYRHGRLHPATRTFQALRIAVNDELKALEAGLAAAWRRLACGPSGRGGRLAVITFQSVEDRLVKRQFAAYAKAGGRLVVKKPVTPAAAELAENPASRSAKLRVIEKVCTH